VWPTSRRRFFGLEISREIKTADAIIGKIADNNRGLAQRNRCTDEWAPKKLKYFFLCRHHTITGAKPVPRPYENKIINYTRLIHFECFCRSGGFLQRENVNWKRCRVSSTRWDFGISRARRFRGSNRGECERWTHILGDLAHRCPFVEGSEALLRYRNFDSCSTSPL
jgi:hypothetical protein